MPQVFIDNDIKFYLINRFKWTLSDFNKYYDTIIHDVDMMAILAGQQLNEFSVIHIVHMFKSLKKYKNDYSHEKFYYRLSNKTFRLGFTNSKNNRLVKPITATEYIQALTKEINLNKRKHAKTLCRRNKSK